MDLLERLRFTMEEQALTVEVAVRNRKVLFASWHGEAPADGLAFRVLENGRRFLRRLEKIHLLQWKKAYAPDSLEEAVKPWQLLLFADGVRRVIKGSAYPENWAAFVDVMNALPGVAIPKVNQVEQLQIFYEGALMPVPGNVYAPRQSGGKLLEKLVVNRGKHILVLTRHKQGFGTERHAFDSLRNVPLLLKRVEAPLAELSALADVPARRQADAAERLEVRFVRRTGEEYLLRFGARHHWPECLRALLREIAVLTYDVKSDMLEAQPENCPTEGLARLEHVMEQAAETEGQA